MEIFSTSLALCAGNSPVPVISPHKGQRRGALMSYLICVWINGWENNREAGELRRYRTHYDVTVMQTLVIVNCVHISWNVLHPSIWSMIKIFVVLEVTWFCHTLYCIPYCVLWKYIHKYIHIYCSFGGCHKQHASSARRAFSESHRLQSAQICIREPKQLFNKYTKFFWIEQGWL